MTPTTQLEVIFLAALRELQLELNGSLTFEVPSNPEFGDYSTNLAMRLFAQQASDLDFKAAYPNPQTVAKAIQDLILADIKLSPKSIIEDISIAGPGFLNIKLSTSFLMEQLLQMATHLDRLITQPDRGKTAIVEYSSPNIAKPFTIGHLRSTIIGEAVANLLEAKGWTVKRDNHLGDWGTQFGKQIYAIKAWGDEAEIEASPQPVKKLVELYVKFHEAAEVDPTLEDAARAWFKKLEDGDAEARRLWQKCIDWSWKEFEGLYQKLGVTFTENNGRGYGESFFEDKMTGILEQLESNPQIDYRSGEDGAKLVFFPNDELPQLMIIKKDGTTLYATRDLATDWFRLQTYGSDITIINEVGAEQALYFQQIYRIEQLLGWYTAVQRVHVKHGLYRFKDKKMSTRKGNVIWLEDVLSEAEERAKQLAVRPKTGSSESAEAHTSLLSSEELLSNSRAIGLGALKWNDLKRSSHMDVVFDWDEMLSMQGNSGPYLQYTNVRCLSILEKAQATSDDKNSSIANHIDPLLYILMPSEKLIIRQLLQFDEIVTKAATEFAPHHLATYLYQLAQSYNSFYNTQPILSAKVLPAEKTVRLALTATVQRVIEEGLKLLGIQTVAKM